MSYKLDAYFAAWDMPFGEGSVTLALMAMGLATVEFVLGIYLLLGIRRRFTTMLCLMVMSGMTLLTLYIYLYNPVTDCGCFGEAITLTNGQTLGKNVVLLLCSIVIIRRQRYLLRLISERNQWITSLYAWVYIILLSLYSLHYLPPVDFTAFREGVNMRAAYEGTDTLAAPDLVGFELFTTNDEPMTAEILADTGRTFLLTLTDVPSADDGCNDRINDIYDECLDRGYRFYCVVPMSADSASCSAWTDRTGAAYSYLRADDTTLRAMVRSNPGLMLIHNGILSQKWSNNNLPLITEESSTPRARAEAQFAQIPLVKMLLWFIIPLLVVIGLDRLWIGSKFYKHFIYKQRLKKEL